MITSVVSTVVLPPQRDQNSRTQQPSVQASPSEGQQTSIEPSREMVVQQIDTSNDGVPVPSLVNDSTKVTVTDTTAPLKATVAQSKVQADPPQNRHGVIFEKAPSPSVDKKSSTFLSSDPLVQAVEQYEEAIRQFYLRPNRNTFLPTSPSKQFKIVEELVKSLSCIAKFRLLCSKSFDVESSEFRYMEIVLALVMTDMYMGFAHSLEDDLLVWTDLVHMGRIWMQLPSPDV